MNAGGAEGDYMKKFLALFLAIVMAMSLGLLASCGNTAGTSETCAHTETERVVTRDATCTVNGVAKKKCKKCGKYVGEDEVIPKLGHEYVAGFCDRTGCNTVDPANNKFYADMVISMADSDRVTVKNNGDIVIKTDMNKPEKAAEYKITDLDILDGKSEGVIGEDGKETGVKQLLSGKIESDFVNGTLSVVAGENEVKLVVKNAGEEVVYARVDGEAAKKLITSAIGLIPDFGGSIPDIGGTTGGTSGFDLSSKLDTLRKADGTDATVKQVNALLHNIVTSVATPEKIETGYKFVLDYDKVKELNNTMATQNVKDFADNMFGEKTFDSYISMVISYAIQSDNSLTDAEKTAKITEVTNDCKTLSLYAMIAKYASNDETTIDPQEIKKQIDEAADMLKGIEIAAITSEKGNISSFKLGFKDWEFASGSDSSSVIQLPSVHIDGEIEVKFTNERVKGDEYLPFEETENLHDTTIETAGTLNGTTTSDDVLSVRFTVNEKGDIVKVETIYREGVYDSATEQMNYTYYKVVNENPVAVVRSTDEGKVTYNVRNLLVADTGNDTIILGAANIKVYEVSADGATELRTLTEDEIMNIAYTVDEVEFTIVVIG